MMSFTGSRGSFLGDTNFYGKQVSAVECGLRSCSEHRELHMCCVVNVIPRVWTSTLKSRLWPQCGEKGMQGANLHFLCQCCKTKSLYKWGSCDWRKRCNHISRCLLSLLLLDLTWTSWLTPLSTRNHHSKSLEFGSIFKLSQIFHWCRGVNHKHPSAEMFPLKVAHIITNQCKMDRAILQGWYHGNYV